MNDFADYGSSEAHKLLSDNRELYLAQSAATTTGRAAPFPSPSAVADSLPASVDGPFYSQEPAS